MAKNKLSDLRDHLFETLEALKDPEKPMDIARAKAVCNVAQVIINSATVEVKYLNAIGGGEKAGKFFDVEGDSGQKTLPKPNGRAAH